MNEAAQAAETAARESYGRLLSWLAWQWRDIAAAEDALAEAFACALARWPADGVPSAPDAWLLTTARRNPLVAARRQRLADDPALTILWPTDDTAAIDAPAIPDSRLRMMFVCAHPAIDATVRSALMLQTVLGLDAATIASAFLVKPQALAKRLVRAKAKIKATGIRFEEPERAEWPERLDSVLEAIYGAYALHWGRADDDAVRQLADESLFLARLVATLLPGQPEALGLAALLSYCEARRAARLDAQGGFVPLDEQLTSRWDRNLMRQANEYLAQAAASKQPGPYQLEAAIQAAHMEGLESGDVPWVAIERLFEELIAVGSTLGASIGHAVAAAHAADDPGRGLRLLDSIPSNLVIGHQPWWTARAKLLVWAGRSGAASDAYGRALALTNDSAIRGWLAERMAALGVR